MDDFEKQDVISGEEPEQNNAVSGEEGQDPVFSGEEPSPVSGGYEEQSGSSEPVYAEPAGEVPPRQEPVRPARKSPYENSPYERPMENRQEQFRYEPQPRPAKAAKKHRSAGRFWRGALAVCLVAVMVAGGCLITARSVNNTWRKNTEQTTMKLEQRIQELEQKIQEQDSKAPVSGSAVASTGGMTPAQVYQQNVDSVVAISVTVKTQSFGQIMEGSSSGSGFILTEDGYVVTNYHVVEGGTSITVIMNDGTQLEAKVVGSDSTNDVAVLKVEAQNLPAVTLGSSSELIVGDMVVAIGNPLGELNSTQTVGYVCGKDREVTTGGTIINMIQTDAAINPGNSGGPLFNMNGEVIGITTAKYSGTTSSGASIEGIGFAIPIDDVMGIIGDLQSYGYVTGAYLGISVQDVASEFSSAYGISGACVVSVEPGYAAERAGVQPRDIIVALNGQDITSITSLTRALRGYKAGDTVQLTVIRSGEKLTLDVILDERPQNLGSTSTVPDQEQMPSEGNYDEWYEYFRRYFGG
ncbi:MAG: trypsin-like peptidase domain-containing protein [Faecousia sp.]